MCDLCDKLKKQSNGFQTAYDPDKGIFMIVIDVKSPIGTSQKGNNIFATSNGIQGTPWGNGFFLEILLGQNVKSKQ